MRSIVRTLLLLLLLGRPYGRERSLTTPLSKMDLGRHPSRKHSVQGKTPPRELEVVNSMNYEQASIDSFDSASRAVAEMLTVS